VQHLPLNYPAYRALPQVRAIISICHPERSSNFRK